MKPTALLLLVFLHSAISIAPLTGDDLSSAAVADPISSAQGLISRLLGSTYLSKFKLEVIKAG